MKTFHRIPAIALASTLALASSALFAQTTPNSNVNNNRGSESLPTPQTNGIGTGNMGNNQGNMPTRNGTTSGTARGMGNGTNYGTGSGNSAQAPLGTTSSETTGTSDGSRSGTTGQRRARADRN